MRGRRFAAVSDAPEGEGSVISIRDASDGTELQQADIPGEASVLYFDLPENELLVGTTEGELIVIGLDS